MAATATLLTRGIQGESLSAATDRLVNQILFVEGVVDVPGASLEVLQNLGTDMNVKIGSGTAFDRAVVAGDLAGQGTFLPEHQNATQVLAVAASDPTLDRIDLVILKVYDDTFDSSGNNYADLEVITGTPDASPTPPALPSTSIPLAEILVQNAVTQIVNGDITDKRIEYQLAASLQSSAHDEVRDSAEVASATATTSDASKASVSLTIPTTWGSWDCEAHATYVREIQGNIDVIGTFTTRIQIDGTNQQDHVQDRAAEVGEDGGGGGRGSGNLEIGGAVGGHRAGMTTTGSRAIQLRASCDTGTVPMTDIYLYARAVRTS